MKRLWWFSLSFTLAVAGVSPQANPLSVSPIRPLEPRDLAPRAVRAYTFRAGAGDLVTGPLHVLSGALTWELYDPQQTKLKAQWISEGSDDRVGFVAPTAGVYRVVLTAQG